MVNKPRILTGMRTTGRLHLGHLVGALNLSKELEDSNRFDCYFLLANAQALTDHADNPRLIRDSVLQVALDWLAVGLNPDKSAFVIQSEITETFELEHYFASVIPNATVLRVPTLKAEILQLEAQRQTVTSAFVRYPVQQAADILIVAGGNKTPILVPVGGDQVSHIELSREIARAFNKYYGLVFPEPKAEVGKIGRLVGTDGQAKMSKSLGNVIQLSDSADMVRSIIMRMYTDPTRIHATDPGHVENNPVFMYHDIFNPNKDEVSDLKERYTKGKVGDVEVKEKLVVAINELLEPMRNRRAMFENHVGDVWDYLREGTKREKRIAEETMLTVKKAMGLLY